MKLPLNSLGTNLAISGACDHTLDGAEQTMNELGYQFKVACMYESRQSYLGQLIKSISDMP
jgi:hypothetical protein